MIFKQEPAERPKSSRQTLADDVFQWTAALRPLRVSVQILFLLLLSFPFHLRADDGALADLWFTPDQRGRRLFDQGDYAVAAKAFEDPLWQGTAWYRAGEFEKAAQAFGRRDTADALYNQGNAWLMNGKYDTAITSYDRALRLRPDWREARENRDLAAARAKLVETKGGDMTGGQLEADEIVFDENARDSESQAETVGGEQLSDQEIQALWLRRVQTRPADFLKAKFSYQIREKKEEG